MPNFCHQKSSLTAYGSVDLNYFVLFMTSQFNKELNKKNCYKKQINAICPEERFSSLALSSVYSQTIEDGSLSTPMLPAQLSAPLQQVEE